MQEYLVPSPEGRAKIFMELVSFSDDTFWGLGFFQEVQLVCSESSRRVQPVKTYLCSLLAN